MSYDPNAGLGPATPDASAAPDAGGLPPELMALLGGGGADAGAAPTEETAEAPSGGSDPVSIIRQMIDLAKQYIEVEPDEEDKLTMTKNVLASLQQYLAKDQKEGEEMLAGKISPRAMRRAGVGGE